LPGTAATDGMLGHIIVRLVAILFGLALAFLAAGIFISFGLFGGYFLDFVQQADLQGGEGPPMAAFAVFAVGLLSSFKIASLALAPSAFAILVAELMGWRGLTVNLVLGGIVGLATGWIVSGGHSQMSQGALLVLLATGFIGGFFYWLIAGRGAGGWR
jgi:hypothetical protein